MTTAVGSEKASSGDITTRAGARRFFVLCGTAVVLCTAWMTLIVSRGYFFVDDYINMRQARATPFGWHYLSMGVFGHLLPGYRFTYMVLGVTLPYNYGAAATLMVMLFASTLVLFAVVGHELVGPRLAIPVLTGWLGFSVLIGPTMLWFASFIETLPAMAATLTCLWCFLRREATGRNRYLFLLIPAFCVGLSFYEIVLLVPFVLVLLCVLFVDAGQGIPGIVAKMLARWPVWVSLGVPAVIYLGYYETHHYSSGTPTLAASVGIGSYLVMWFEAVAPSFYGHSSYYGNGSYLGVPPSIATMAAGQLVAVAVVVVTWFRSWQRTVRSLLFFAVATCAYFAPVVLMRAGLSGTAVGRDYLYLTPVAWLFPLSILLAWHPLARSTSLGSSTSRRPQHRSHRATTGWRAMAGLLVVLLALGLGARGQWGQFSAFGPYTQRMKVVAGNFVRSADELRGKGTPFFVYDTPLDQAALAFDHKFYPYDLMSQTVGQMRPWVAFSGAASMTTAAYAAVDDGTLVPSRFVAHAVVSSPEVDVVHGRFCLAERTVVTQVAFAVDPRLPKAFWTVQTSVTSGGQASAQMGVGSLAGSIAYPAPLALRVGQVFNTALGETSISKIYLNIRPGASFCGSIAVGQPTPSSVRRVTSTLSPARN